MTLTKEWTTFQAQSLQVPTLGNYAYRQQIVLSPSVAGSVHIRTIFRAQIKVLVPASGVAPPTNWWSTGYCEVRAVHSPDGSDPAPSVNVAQKGDLGRSLLKVRALVDPGGAPTYHVLFDQEDLVDTATYRDATPGDTPAVWFYTYYGDVDHALNGAYNPGITVNFQCSTLWGH